MFSGDRSFRIFSFWSAATASWKFYFELPLPLPSPGCFDGKKLLGFSLLQLIFVSIILFIMNFSLVFSIKLTKKSVSIRNFFAFLKNEFLLNVSVEFSDRKLDRKKTVFEIPRTFFRSSTHSSCTHPQVSMSVCWKRSLLTL